MYEGGCWSSVVPGVTDQTCRSGQDRGRVQGAGGEVVAQLVAVVGKVADLEHEADEEERKQDDSGSDETNVEVELQVGLFVLGPGQGDVGEEPGDALVDHVGLQGQGQDAVPEAPEAVTVHWALLGWRTSPGRPHGHRGPRPGQGLRGSGTSSDTHRQT